LNKRELRAVKTTKASFILTSVKDCIKVGRKKKNKEHLYLLLKSPFPSNLSALILIVFAQIKKGKKSL
jgi:hypothetical protein